ncbi:MAG: SPFH domain-containing protein [Solirubrobacterales bacterium]|nr:SPFH domain-containing protein [Solirubrobacterales bacterium]
MIVAIGIVLAVLAVIALTVAGASFRVLREYERGVVFRLGRVMDIRGPGLILLMPTIDRMVRVSLRTVTLTVPPQEVITRDNIPVRVTAVTYYRVVDPNRAVNQVENFHNATLQIAQTTLRSVLGGADLDHLLSERESLNESLQQVIDAQTEPWGIKVTTVEIKDVEIPERMQHAIARQAEAERERRAKIINAEGEAQAATRLADAAEVIGRNPTTLQLRYLQTLREIGATQNSTVVFPMPIDLVKPVLEAMRQTGEAATQPGQTAEAAAAPGQTAEAAAAPGQLSAPVEKPAESASENGALEAGESRALNAGPDPATPTEPPASTRQAPSSSSEAPSSSSEA